MYMLKVKCQKVASHSHQKLPCSLFSNNTVISCENQETLRQAFTVIGKIKTNKNPKKWFQTFAPPSLCAEFDTVEGCFDIDH